MSDLQRENGIAASLVSAFPFLEGGVAVRRERRIWAEVESSRFREVFDEAAGELGFGMLCVITGMDEGDAIGLVYHLSDARGDVLSIHTRASKPESRIASVTDRFPSAHIYEREIVDLLGASFDGLAPGNRYPLPDDWPEGQHPLLKEWKPGTGPEEES